MTQHSARTAAELPTVHGLLWGTDSDRLTRALSGLREAFAGTHRIVAVNTVPGTSDPFRDEDYRRPEVVGSHRGTGYSWIARLTADSAPAAARAARQRLPAAVETCPCLSGDGSHLGLH